MLFRSSVLGLNPWSTPFEIWCAVTKTYEKPFEDTKYTLAGKAIEPKQIAYMQSMYQMDDLRTPTDLYGADYFNKTFGDFFPDVRALGGMWDSILVDENGKPTAVLEFKTTSRIEDWEKDVPEYYALQASLYAYLLGVEKVIMVCSALEPTDYDHPENFVPSVSNTFTRPFNLHERYPSFEGMVDFALAWWDAHVETGISPDYDEQKDAEILKALRTVSVDASGEDDLAGLLAEADSLKDEIEAEKLRLKEKTDRLDALTEAFKSIAKKRFGPDDKYVELTGGHYVWKMTRGTTTKIDEKRLKADNLYDKYTTTSETFRMTCTKRGEDK